MKLNLSKACSERGADMGRPNRLPQDVNALIKLRMERLKWVDGDYDEKGAYWGNSSGASIYCAYMSNVQIFVRAKSRKDAKSLVRDILPAATFFH